MGAPKQKWTSEEEEALRAGVAKHGSGKWKNIQKDPEFGTCLAARSNIDLKDKWRNMNVSANGQGSREKVRTPKIKALPAPPSCTALIPFPMPVAQEAATDTVMDASKSPQEGKSNPKYTGMIYDALQTMKEPGGSDVNAIIGFIEQRNEVPPNFRRQITQKLRRLVNQEKIEKVENRYKLKKDSGTKISTTKQKEVRPKQPQTSTSGIVDNTADEASITAAYKVADAENKSNTAALAVKNTENVMAMAAEAEVVLQIAMDIYEQCSRGEIVLTA